MDLSIRDSEKLQEAELLGWRWKLGGWLGFWIDRINMSLQGNPTKNLQKIASN